MLIRAVVVLGLITLAVVGPWFLFIACAALAILIKHYTLDAVLVALFHDALFATATGAPFGSVFLSTIVVAALALGADIVSSRTFLRTQPFSKV